MLPSLILNALNTVLVTGCMVWGIRKSNPASSLFRYFTTLSNILSALASLAVVIALICGALPLWTLLLKYAGTVAVTVTLLTVFLFLGPSTHDWKGLLYGAELLLHLICPLLAIVSLLVFEKTAMPAWSIAVGILPVALYAVLYWYKVVRAPEERRWKDFYGFNRGGKWPLTFTLMLIGATLIAVALWAI